MKKYFSDIVSLLIISLLSACTTIYDPMPYIRLSSSDGMVNISQDGTSANVYADSDGLSVFISVSSNWNWRIESSEDNWCAVSVSEEGIDLTASANETGEVRTCSFVIVSLNEAGESRASVEVEQLPCQSSPLEVKLVGDDSEIILPEQGGSYKVEVVSDELWTVVSNSEWFAVEQDGNGFTVTAAENTTFDTISGMLQVTAGNGGEGKSATVNISQFSSVKAMVIELTVGETTSNIGALPFDNTGVINCLVDWGDGTLSRVLSSWPQHQYSASGVYDVKIVGKVSSFRANQIPEFSDELKNCVTAIKSWGNIGLESLKRGFYKCQNLKYIAAPDPESFSILTSVYECFYSNISLETIPEGMFSNAPELLEGYAAFTSCSALKAAPSRLFAGCSKCETFFRLFWKCTSLSDVAPDIFEGCSSAEEFGQAFYNTPIKSIPQELFSSCSAATEFANLFNGCAELVSVPENLFSGLAEVTSYSSAFSNCTSLTSVPENLFADSPEVTNFSNVFMGCSSLETVPCGIFNNNMKVTNFGNAFSGCVSLKGESPFVQVNGMKYHLYERTTEAGFAAIKTTKGCFKDCTGLDDYSVIETSYSEWL